MGVTAQMIFLTLLVALAGCASADPLQAPVSPSATPPPAPFVWYKADAAQEEFQRTRARCLLQAGAGTANFDFEPVAFVLCMRAEGWVRRQPVRQQ
jgi:predicted small lipoprotein YifL